MSSVDSKSLFIRSESDEDSVPSGAPSLSPSLSSIAESFSRRPGSNSHPQQPQFVTFDGKKTRDIIVQVDIWATRSLMTSKLLNLKTLKLLLSFAVGGLLGDVFLHLLPEAWSGDMTTEGEHPSMRSGLWVLAGILIFTIVEKIFSGYTNADENNPQPKCVEIANCLLRKHGGKLPANGTAIKCTVNGKCDIEDVPNGCYLAAQERKEKEPQRKVAGYLNLLANSIDNFTHGLAIAGSFLVSFRHGVLATFAILLHEIPHEVGDFAILLRSGFSRWDAAKAQLLTAGAGLIGALVAIFGSSVTSAVETRTSWIMPFTAGGFLHISLVTVLPDLLQESDTRESLKQFTALIFGILVMAFMTIVFES
uniref:Uncharacterized protein n=1 Tax=Phlebotomus papatasi TaxID=29031 RepID=A0A1B0DEG7_PHLPP